MNFRHFKTIIGLGLPLMIGSVLQILMHTMDVYFISGLGSDFVAASSMGAAIAGVLFVFSMLVSTGAVALVARKYGGNDMNAVKSYGMSSVILSLILGVIIGLVAVIFSSQIIGIYDPEPSLFSIIKDYVDILFAFIPLLFLGTTLRSVIQSMGDTKGPLYVFGTANLLNIVLDYIFIVHFHWGIKGAAWATVISQTFASLLLLHMFIKSMYGYKCFIRSIHISISEYIDILSIGFWACIQSIARPITGLIMMRIVYDVAGIDGSAAFGIGQNVINYFFIVLSGLSGAITILVGQKIGENNIEEAKGIVKEGVVYSYINLIIFFIPYMIFTEQLFMLFHPNETVLAYGVSYIRTIFVGFIILGHIFIYRGAFAGAGDTFPPMIAALTANVVIKLTTSVIFTSFLNLGIKGVWIAIMLSIFAEGILMMNFYKSNRLYTKVIGNH